MSDLVVALPNGEELKQEVERLRTEVSMLFFERDELRFVICKNVETEFMLTIGYLEYKVFQVECTFRRLKRKCELLQALKNRQAPIDEAAIEQQLDQEFSSFSARLQEMFGQMDNAFKRSEMGVLSEEDAKEAKRLYRLLVKQLHPDLHPDQSEEDLVLYQRAVEAYENGLLAMLQILVEIVGKPTSSDVPDSARFLYQEKKRLQELIESIQSEIDTIKTQFPYTMKEFLSDEAAITAQKEKLQQAQASFQEGIEYYQAQIKALLGG